MILREILNEGSMSILYLFWVAKTVLVFLPSLEEVVVVLAELSPPLEDGPAPAVGLHVAPDSHLLIRHKDGGETTGGDGSSLLQV